MKWFIGDYRIPEERNDIQKKPVSLLALMISLAVLIGLICLALFDDVRLPFQP